MIIMLFRSDRRENIDIEEDQALSSHMNELVKQLTGFISVNRFMAEDWESFGLARFESKEALQAGERIPIILMPSA